jgi:shikimate dehydrogenase
MHNAAFAALGLGWSYSVIPTPPGQVGRALAELRSRGFRGANVTVPHKQAVLPYLDRTTADAQAIGAVNTIQVEGEVLLGDNTDGAGFLADLRAGGFEPAGQRALVLGAGGGARAVVYALAQARCAVTIQNRTEQRAAQLAGDMAELDFRPAAAYPGRWRYQADSKGRQPSAQVAWMRGGPTAADLESFDLLVNATSVGMWPQEDASPWPEALPIPAQWTVYDLVYNPQETRLLSLARASGASVLGGLGMLVHQGALAFELWTGCNAPIDVMRAAAEKALRRRAMHGGEHGWTRPSGRDTQGPEAT